jgi:hypothetical protein
MAGSSDAEVIGTASMADIVSAVLDDCLYNIISDTVLKQHREEKQLRMQTAAIVAQQARDNAKAESPGTPVQPITTAGASIDENDRIYLHDNPLRTIQEILCPTCRLPRLQYPTTGRGARPPDSSKQYCPREPYIDKDGCDIYGKSLAIEKPSKKKAEKAKKEKAGSRSGSDSEGEGGGKESKPATTSIPSGKCPYCPRYMTFNRIAQHMDRCQGINSRQSSKIAMNKLQSNTPQASSRGSTPKPSTAATTAGSGAASSQGLGAGVNGKKRKLEKGSDDEAEESTPIKKKKLLIGKKDKDGKVKPVNSSLQRVKSGDKRPPGEGESNGKREATPKKDD